MKKVAQLQDLFQTHGIVKILDHLTLYKDFEYTKTDIANETGISRRTLYQVWPVIERFDLVRTTKSAGKIKFYKLNTENPISKQLVALADKISFFEADKIAGLETRPILQATVPTPVPSSEIRKPVKITGELIALKQSFTLEGNLSQAKELFEKALDLTNGEIKIPGTDSTETEVIRGKKEPILRIRFRDGRPIKLVVEK